MSTTIEKHQMVSPDEFLDFQRQVALSPGEARPTDNPLCRSPKRDQVPVEDKLRFIPDRHFIA